MDVDGQRKAVADVTQQIAELLQEVMSTHGVAVALGGMVSAVALMIGTLDRNPNVRALATWQRTFTVCYDAALYDDPSLRPADEA